MGSDGKPKKSATPQGNRARRLLDEAGERQYGFDQHLLLGVPGADRGALSVRATRSHDGYASAE